jgi:superfamily II DNA or RNA helicase
VKVLITPREYQTEAVAAVLSKWRDGVTRQIVSLPTGCGKTIIFGLLGKDFAQRTLVLAHRDELLTQAAEKMLLVNPNADIGIFKAEQRGGLEREICIASVQTATRHTGWLKEKGFTLCICDEVHHGTSQSYVKVFQDLGFMEGDASKLLLGVTATAFRADGQGLGEVFQEIVFERSILAMIRAGYLVDVRGIAIGTNTNIERVHTRAGDFAADELEKAVDTPERNGLIAKAYLEHGKNRPGIVFGVSVEHAKNIAAAFQEQGVSAAAVWGDMDDDERKKTLAAFSAGEVQVLSNCQLLTEGYDAPEIGVVMMARPTKSRGLYVQCVGRGLRLAPGKESCILLDFVDVSRRHDLCNFGTLAEGKVKIKKGQTLLEAVGEAEEAEKRAATAPLRHTSEALDLFGRSRFVWTASGRNYRLGLGDGRAVVCAPTSGGYTVLLVEKDGATTPITEGFIPLGYAQGVAEDYARQNAQAAFIDKEAKWRGYPASDKQIDLLERLGITYPTDITKGEASQLIDEAMNEPVTDRQLFFIQRHRLHSNPAILTKKTAGTLIVKYKGGMGATV